MTMTNKKKFRDPNPVHAWFGLTYSSYLVIPRLALESMTLDWQERFVALLDEATAGGLRTPHYTVQRRDKRGHFVKDDHWANYRYGNVAAAMKIDEKLER